MHVEETQAPVSMTSQRIGKQRTGLVSRCGSEAGLVHAQFFSTHCFKAARASSHG